MSNLVPWVYSWKKINTTHTCKNMHNISTMEEHHWEWKTSYKHERKTSFHNCPIMHTPIYHIHTIIFRRQCNRSSCWHMDCHAIMTQKHPFYFHCEWAMAMKGIRRIEIGTHNLLPDQSCIRIGCQNSS